MYCPLDCPPPPVYCGNGICDGTETRVTCPQDCKKCGDLICDGAGGENCQTCPKDCKDVQNGLNDGCPSCTFDNAADICPQAIPKEQQDCAGVSFFCGVDNKCAYNMDALTGKACGPNATAPYSDACHVDVCIRGVCVMNATILSSDPTSAGGALPLTNPGKPWIKEECVYDPISGKIIVNTTRIHPYPNDGLCEPLLGETQVNDCQDCNCSSGFSCRNNVCVSIIPPPIPPIPETWQAWVPWVVLAILIGYFLAAIVYMASHIIGSPELEAWAKNEIYEVSVSALIVGCAVGLVAILFSISTTLIGANYVDVANNYVYLLSADLLRVYGLITKGIFAMGLLGYVGADLSMPAVPLPVMVGVTGGIYPFGGMSLLTGTLTMYTNVLTFAIISVIGQKVILDFILQSAFRVFLPFGLLLRSFTFTRKIGATLMAVAICAYIVYPITLVMNAQIYASVPQIPASEFHSSLLPLNEFNMGEWMDVFLGPNFGKYCQHWWDWIAFCWLRAIIAWILAFIVALFHAITFVMRVLSAAITHGVANVTADGFDYYAYLIPWAIQPIVAAFLFPILDFIIVITAMRSLSEAIGGESKITGLAEFI